MDLSGAGGPASLAEIEAEIVRVESERVRRSDASRCVESLADFVRGAWHTVEPGVDLIWGWHLDAICSHLEAVTAGRMRRLLVNVPPGHMKSLVVSVFWPAWVWLRRPSWRVLFGSYAQELSTRDSRRCREVIASEWYQTTFRPRWKLKEDQNVKTWFENTAGGLRMALAVGGKGTGFRGDCTVFDDPHNVLEHQSEEKLAKVVHWWDKRMSSRLNDMRSGARVGIMQRVHERDLSGHILERGGYEHLCLPTRFDAGRPCRTSIFRDPRKRDGELLFPAMFPAEVVAEIEVDLGPYDFNGQHQQNPLPAGHGILKPYWLGFWFPSDMVPPAPVQVRNEDGEIVRCRQRRLPATFDGMVTSWDMAFKDAETGSLVAGSVWAWIGAMSYMLDLVEGHWDAVRSAAEVAELADVWQGCRAHLVEDKANGPAVISMLRDRVEGLTPVSPEGDKLARTHAAAPTIAAGQMWIPHPEVYPWVGAFVDQITNFPKWRINDAHDTMTQFFAWKRKAKKGLALG